MRIVAGSKRGLKLNTIESDSTRPTKDMVREALFSIILEYIPNSTVLDLFAGSGAIGIEALSRGASKCYFSDNNPECIKVIKDNLTKASFLNQSETYKLDYLDMIDKVRNVSFDVIYIDPPYNLGLGIKAIERISSYDLLKKNGILVFETDTGELAPDEIGVFTKIKSKKYGRNFLSFYERKEKWFLSIMLLRRE